MQAYSNSLVDHHLVLDLLPPLSHAYFRGCLPAPLSYSQAAILACVGLQQHEIGKVGVVGWVREEAVSVRCCDGGVFAFMPPSYC